MEALQIAVKEIILVVRSLIYSEFQCINTRRWDVRALYGTVQGI